MFHCVTPHVPSLVTTEKLPIKKYCCFNVAEGILHLCPFLQYKPNTEVTAHLESFKHSPSRSGARSSLSGGVEAWKEPSTAHCQSSGERDGNPQVAAQ